MMNRQRWVIDPLVSVGPFIFGTTRSQIHKLHLTKRQTFRKTDSTKGVSEAYEGYHLHYDANDRLEAVEVFDASIEVTLNGKRVFPLTKPEIKTIISDMKEISGLLFSAQCSIGICFDDNLNAQSFLAACRGYYEDIC